MSWQWADLSKNAKTPPAGDICAYGVPVCPDDSGLIQLDTSGCPIKTERLVYRGTDNAIYELAVEGGEAPSAWNNLLSASTHPPGKSAPAALSDPTALIPSAVPTVVYQGKDQNIYQISLNDEKGWIWSNISTNDGKTAPAPQAAGRPFGYSSSDQIARVVYRGLHDNHIYELSALEWDTWRFNNLSTNDKTVVKTAKEQKAEAAAGNPFGYVGQGGVARVVYRGADGNIYELHLEPAHWKLNNLSSISGAPQAAGDPYAYITNDNVARVLYRGADGQIHELRLEGHWKHASLSTNDKTAPPAPAAVGDPFGYVSSDGVARVVYWGTGGNIYELHLEPQHWKWNNLSSVSGASQAAGNPVGFSLIEDIDTTARVLYRDIHNHLCVISLPIIWP